MFFYQAFAVVALAAATASEGLHVEDFGYPLAYAKPYVPSPAEIASAIQAAKEAATNVMAAQNRVQQAKDEVLDQQHIASHKQQQAALALQKTEAAAAVQQQQAKAAANALVQAQQRLARAKSEVAELQKIAALKEARAAAVIHKSAAAAAAEIQKDDENARKLAAIRDQNSAILKQSAGARDGALTATGAAVAAAANGAQHVAWVQLNPWG